MTMSMAPLLAAAACRGAIEELRFLLDPRLPPRNLSQKFINQVVAYHSGNSTIESSTMQQASGDVEGVFTTQSLLQGVTMEGDTALHLVAVNGEGSDFLSCAKLIHEHFRPLLYMRNRKGDTPLHYAVRAGKLEMASCLINLASGDSISKELLREQNATMETALHEAVRIRDNRLVLLLLEADRQLACFPREGTSPLYLAIMLKEDSIAKSLYHQGENVSYSGPNRQNVMHAAVLQGSAGMVKELMEWNYNLMTQMDDNGSTPLHFAACAHFNHGIIELLLEANSAAIYQADHNGVFPIHAAASIGAKLIVSSFILKYPSCAGLRNSTGMTFLHLAVLNKRSNVVRLACRNQGLSWILNMQDEDGNTALHYAIKNRDVGLFSILIRNRNIYLDLANKRGLTPRDIAKLTNPTPLYYSTDRRHIIYRSLQYLNAASGNIRPDYFLMNEDTNNEGDALQKIVDSIQILGIGSVLVATVAFTVAFTLPGGYRADDHPNGGTPTLAGSYAFNAFIVASAVAFVCSLLGTLGLMNAGVGQTDLSTRIMHFSAAVGLVRSSVRSLAAAFALGMYVVLAPVARKTAITVCVITSAILLYEVLDLLPMIFLALNLKARSGAKAFIMIGLQILIRMSMKHWSYLLIFLLPAYMKK